MNKNLKMKKINKQILKLIIKIKNFCKNTNKKFYLSNNIKVAIKLDLDGVYLPSFNKQIIQNCYLHKNSHFGLIF